MKRISPTALRLLIIGLLAGCGAAAPLAPEYPPRHGEETTSEVTVRTAEREPLRAAPLVVLGPLAPSNAAAIEGTVVDVDTAEGTLLVNDGTMDRCVSAVGADIYIVDDDDGFSSSRGDLDDLSPGQPVSIFGTEDLDGCLVADTILAEAPVAVPL